jgi:hypothetical protein
MYHSNKLLSFYRFVDPQLPLQKDIQHTNPRLTCDSYGKTFNKFTNIFGKHYTYV